MIHGTHGQRLLQPLEPGNQGLEEQTTEEEIDTHKLGVWILLFQASKLMIDVFFTKAERSQILKEFDEKIKATIEEPE